MTGAVDLPLGRAFVEQIQLGTAGVVVVSVTIATAADQRNAGPWLGSCVWEAITRASQAEVAQAAEHRPRNAEVAVSTPALGSRTPPYPWCRTPTDCAPRGYCARRPSCGD